jgi:hypothetical protein
MRLYVAVTDKDWFSLHASKPEVEEVNFWRPSPDATFKALQPGELLLFKLHSPDNFIAGGGFFTRFLQLPVNLVWDTFGEANGVRSQSEMRERIAYYTPNDNVENMPAYEALKRGGMDTCGLAQLASRTVGVPFVGLVAACLVISELLRRLNGGRSFELISCSAAALGDIESIGTESGTYAYGHLPVAKC